MNEFKVGDTIYYFNSGYDAYAIYGHMSLKQLCIEKKVILYSYDGQSYPWGYKSRREALEALAKHLNELLKEDNVY